MIRDFLLFFNENIVIEYSEDLYNDFIMQLGGKRFGHGLFNSFYKFLNEEIPLYADACLAKSFFAEWMNNFGKSIVYGRCAGYKVPLFLGGEDSVNNLEDSDMEVYWSVLTQVKSRL